MKCFPLLVPITVVKPSNTTATVCNFKSGGLGGGRYERSSSNDFHSSWNLLAQFCETLKFTSLTSSVVIATTLSAVAPSTFKFSRKIITLLICVTTVQLSNSMLLLFPSTILSRVVARFFQERFLDFCCQVLNPWTAFSFILLIVG
ncbi:hypothetical protein V8G54_019315 [Vigna mungo]|uniref:Uncharacterized protein n=1 Tax=Vigna mungo TaxID=3915 RepID=A0AAQ3N9W5_VIGMU